MSLKYAWNCIGADSGRKQSWPLPLTLKNQRSSWNRLNLWWKYVKICEHYERIIWCWLFELLFRVTLGTFLLYIYIHTCRNHEVLLKWTCFSCPTSKTLSVIYRGMWFSFTHSLNMSMYTTRKQPHHLLLGGSSILLWLYKCHFLVK